MTLKLYKCRFQYTAYGHCMSWTVLLHSGFDFSVTLNCDVFRVRLMTLSFKWFSLPRAFDSSSSWPHMEFRRRRRIRSNRFRSGRQLSWQKPTNSSVSIINSASVVVLRVQSVDLGRPRWDDEKSHRWLIVYSA